MTGNYKDTIKNVKSYVLKATVTLTGTGLNGSGYFGTYDGAAHAATATVTGVGGVVLGQVTSSTTHTNVGIYSDTVTFLGDANYKAASKSPQELHHRLSQHDNRRSRISGVTYDAWTGSQSVSGTRKTCEKRGTGRKRYRHEFRVSRTSLSRFTTNEI